MILLRAMGAYWNEYGKYELTVAIPVYVPICKSCILFFRNAGLLISFFCKKQNKNTTYYGLISHDSAVTVAPSLSIFSPARGLANIITKTKQKHNILWTD